MLNPSIKPSLQILYKQVKHPRITIKPDLRIFVGVPLSFSPLDAQDFIHQHQAWIDMTLAKLTKHADSLSKEMQDHKGEILFFGVWTPLATLLDCAPPTLTSHTATPPSPSTSRWIKSHLKAQLQAYIFPQATHYAQLMGVKFTELRITNALSRFGSCTHNNRLFFSLMLVFASRELIDYVIIHELAHIRHKNHSKAFWDFVQAHCTHHKYKRIALRQKAKIYPLLLQQLEIQLYNHKPFFIQNQKDSQNK